MSFDSSVDKVIGIEGRYSNDPADSGGETMWGITKRVALAHGYEGAMADMPRDKAKSIYKEGYWDPLMLDNVAVLMPALADELFDIEVNLPSGKAATFLQRSLNVMNQQGAMYADIEVDGRIGRLTLAALREYLTRRGAQGVVVLLRAVNSLLGNYYIELAEQRTKDERFVYGWFNQRVA